MKWGALFLFGWVSVAGAMEYYPVEALRPGMHGVTMTVLQGTQIEPVDTEIMGVAKNYLGPGQDIIIAKLVDPKTALTFAVHGMSGSPLYIDGKLVGALSRGITDFGKDGQCGFTPIRDMLAVNEKVEKSPDASPLTAMLSASFFSEKTLKTAREITSHFLSIPLGISGVNEEDGRRLLSAFGLDKMELMAVPGAGGEERKGGGPDSLQPGAALAAVLMTGDVRMGGTGTLTWREGDRILAFGHPMFGYGDSNLGMGTAEIVTTVPSYQYPYKLANQGAVVGTITQDRFSAIGGIVGKLPRLLPYRIERYHDGKLQQVLQGRFVAHPLLNPMMFSAAILSSLDSNNDISRVFSLTVSGELRLKDHAPLQIGGEYGGQDFDLTEALTDVAAPITNLYAQQWEEIQPEGLTLKVETSEKQQVWSIERIVTDADHYECGQEIPVQVFLRERYGAQEQRTFSLQLPENLKRGSVAIKVAGAASLDDAALSQNVDSVHNVDALVELLNRRRTANHLYAQLVTNVAGETESAQEQPGLPPSVRTVLNGGNRSDDDNPLFEQVWVEQQVSIPGIVQGQQRVSIEIK